MPFIARVYLLNFAHTQFFFRSSIFEISVRVREVTAVNFIIIELKREKKVSERFFLFFRA